MNRRGLLQAAIPAAVFATPTQVKAAPPTGSEYVRIWEAPEGEHIVGFHMVGGEILIATNKGLYGPRGF